MKTSQGWGGFVPKYYNRTPFAKNCHRWIEQTIYFLVGIRGAGTSKQWSSGSDQQAAGWNQATGIHAGFPQLCQIFSRSTGWSRAWIKRQLVMGNKWGNKIIWNKTPLFWFKLKSYKYHACATVRRVPHRDKKKYRVFSPEARRWQAWYRVIFAICVNVREALFECWKLVFAV